tara:strand:- start:5596 stop:5919 length:324 start_codon:yes stop_codon:yes gene_type:complete
LLSIKPGVNANHLTPAIVLALIVCERVYADFGYATVLTSGLEGRHGETSLHYAGAAIDLRTRHVAQAHLREMVRAISDALGRDFDVVLEATHLHVEHQPRRVDDGVR